MAIIRVPATQCELRWSECVLKKPRSQTKPPVLVSHPGNTCHEEKGHLLRKLYGLMQIMILMIDFQEKRFWLTAINRNGSFLLASSACTSRVGQVSLCISKPTFSCSSTLPLFLEAGCS